MVGSGLFGHRGFMSAEKALGLAPGPLFHALEARVLLGGDGFLSPLSPGDAPGDLSPPCVAGVMVNGTPGEGLSSIEPGALGVRTLDVTFTESIQFTSAAVSARKVTFTDGVEAPGELLTGLVVTGSGTPTMHITFTGPSVVDTWVKITLKAEGIADLAGNALDGEAPTGGAQRGYLYDASLDLPSGNGSPGGDAVFYVGSLRGDFATAPGETDHRITEEDLDGFLGKFEAGNSDADFRGAGFGSDQPDGWITPTDMDGFISIYEAAVAEGRRLDPLPNAEPHAPPVHTSNGSGGGNWADPGTWDATGVPDAGEDVVIAAGDTVTLNVSYDVGARRSITVGAGATLAIDSAHTLTLADGTLDCSAAGAKIDADRAIEGAGSIKLSSTSACTGLLNLTAGAWTAPAGATWTVDGDGVFGPAGDAPNLAVESAPGAGGTVTLLTPLNLRSFTLTNGTLDPNNQVAANGYTVSLNGGTLTYKGGTVTRCYTQFKVGWVSGTTGQWAWAFAGYSASPGLVGIEPGARLATPKPFMASALRIAAGATLDNQGQGIWVLPWADDFWSVGGHIVNYQVGGGIVLRGYANVYNTEMIDIGTHQCISDGTPPEYLRLRGGLACGKLVLESGAGVTRLDMDGGKLTCTGIEFGVTGQGWAGRLDLGEGVHTIVGDIAVAAGSLSAAHVLNFETSSVHLTGNLALAGLTANLGGVLYVHGGHTVDGDSATAIAGNDCIIEGVGSPVVIQNMAGCDGTIFAVNWIDGGNNDAKVQTLAR